MTEKRGRIRTLALMISAALFVVALIAVMAFFAADDTARGGIVLPTAANPSPSPDIYEQTNNGFISVDRYNVARVIGSLSRPACYRQTLHRSDFGGENWNQATVELLVMGEMHKISVTENYEVRNFLTNGEDVYLWYDDDAESVTKLTVPDNVRPDHIAGILTYEAIADYPAERILEIDFLQYPEENGEPCLYIRVQEDSFVDSVFWINMSTGLLIRAEQLDEGQTVYTLQEQALILLEEDDASIAAQMRLPDGTDPFATAAE